MFFLMRNPKFYLEFCRKVYHFVTLKPLWKKEVLKLIIPRSTYFLCGKLKFGYPLYFT